MRRLGADIWAGRSDHGPRLLPSLKGSGFVIRGLTELEEGGENEGRFREFSKRLGMCELCRSQRDSGTSCETKKRRHLARFRKTSL
jgi:hypothetical protein